MQEGNVKQSVTSPRDIAATIERLLDQTTDLEQMAVLTMFLQSLPQQEIFFDTMQETLCAHGFELEKIDVSLWSKGVNPSTTCVLQKRVFALDDREIVVDAGCTNVSFGTHCLARATATLLPEEEMLYGRVWPFQPKGTKYQATDDDLRKMRTLLCARMNEA